MAIFRGDGGSGDSSTDAYASQIAVYAQTATTKANEASASASAAATSATNAAISETASDADALVAAISATAAATSATNAASSETNAGNSATAAATSETNAATSATNSATSATASGTSETNAAASAATATTKASEAATSASDASGSATAASTSATNAATSETNAGNSATSATTSATNAATSATNASNSATAAATSETNAANSATAAAASAAEAADKLPLAGGTLTGPLIVNEPTAVTMSAGTTAQRPTGVAGMFRYNTTDGQFEGYTTEWGSIGGGAADLSLNSFTGDGSDVTFSLSGAAIENNTLVYVDGVYQNKSTYAVSGATPAVVTFSEAPANGAAIEIMVAAISVTDVGTPSDNTVTTAKIVDGAVTSAKLAAGVGGAFNDFLIKTANYTAVTRDQLIVNSGSAVTITLPASPTAGNVVFIKNAGAGTVTVARNGSNINSTADDGSLATDAAATLVYVDGTIGWKEL